MATAVFKAVAEMGVGKAGAGVPALLSAVSPAVTVDVGATHVDPATGDWSYTPV